MFAIFIAMGILCFIAAFKYRSEDKRRNQFEDYVWYKMDDHGWHDAPKKNKKKK